MADPYQQLGNRLRLLRRQRGLTQAQLAERASLSDNFIGMIERGVAHPTLEAIARIADALGMPLRALFEEEDEWPAGTARALVQLESLLRQRDPRDADLILALATAIFQYFPAHTNLHSSNAATQ